MTSLDHHQPVTTGCYGDSTSPLKDDPQNNRFDGLVTICCEVDMVLNGELPSKKPSDVSKAIIKKHHDFDGLYHLLLCQN